MAHRMLNFAIFIVVGALVIGIILAGWLCGMQAVKFTRPSRLTIVKSPEDYDGMLWRDVTFTTSDGVMLAGWYILPEKSSHGAALLMVHGHGSNRAYFLQHAAYLAGQGYALLLFDLRNHGTSAGEVTSMGLREIQDVIAAFNFLAEQPEIDPERIVIFGHSLGGSTAIMAMENLPQARALITDTAYTSLLDVTEDGIPVRSFLMPQIASNVIMGMSNVLAGANLYAVRPIDVIGKIAPRPILLIHGTADDLIAVAHTQRLFEAAGEPKSLYIVEGGGHDNLYVINPAEYERHLSEFLQRYVLVPISEP